MIDIAIKDIESLDISTVHAHKAQFGGKPEWHRTINIKDKYQEFNIVIFSAEKKSLALDLSNGGH